eukprot:3816656-Alexandrium_andersonii.AAC.1
MGPLPGRTTGGQPPILPAAARCAASGSSLPSTFCSGARPSGCLSTGGPSTPPRPGCLRPTRRRG